jgi:uncharacterized SAM-binding protein YcdF (DUF218 family)
VTYYLTKLLPHLFLPLALGIGMVILALVFMLVSRRRLAIGALLMALAVLWIPSLPSVAWVLLWSLERQYPAVPVDRVPASDCIVVLGGVLGAEIYPRAEVELTESIDRVYHAARLFRESKGKFVVVAAGNQPWMGGERPEAERIRDLLIEWGVPRDQVLLDTSSRNTRENAVNASALIKSNSCDSSLLVTSAWHMRRAVGAFSKAGVDVFPVAVDVRLVPGDNGGLFRLLPRADILSVSSMAIHEWMGFWVYRLRGWI